jgi:hypothetical protein
MGLREWAVKPVELKALTRSGLFLFSARCALRAEPWLPAIAAAIWADALRFLVGAAFGDHVDAAEIMRRQTALSDCGARACNGLARADEPRGRCISYATSTLAMAVRSTGLDARPALVKETILVAKLAASIGATWAHAGRVKVGGGKDAVDLVCTRTWSEIRRDIPLVAAHTPAVEASKDRVRALRELAPLWARGEPAWAAPPL